MFAITLLPSLPLLALVSGSVPLTTEDARAELHDSQLDVTVTTSGPVKPDQVRTKIQKRALILYVDGAPVPHGRSLGTEKQPITSHPRPAYAKLEIPFGVGVRCGGPIDVKGGPDGVRASISCTREGPAVGTTAKVAPAAAVVAAAKADADTEAKVEEKPRTRTATSTSTSTSTGGEELKAPPPAPPPAPAATSASATQAEAPAAAPAPGPKTGSGPSLVFPGILLLVAAAGVLYYKRRKVTLDSKRIRIIETASLGPKRALVLAEVNGATMVIGTSEAGISLLSPAPAAPASASPAAASSSAFLSADAGGDPARVTMPGLGATGDDAADDEPSLTANEQGGALARLFSRRQAPPAASPAPAFRDRPIPEDDDDDPFAAVLRDSLEDQELRMRLSNGLNGKVT